MKTIRCILAVTATTIALTGCSAGSLGSSDDSAGGKVSLSFLVDNTPGSTMSATALATDFTAKNPDIAVKVETRPEGSEGDNLIKTRLSTGDMSDVFLYNSGSLFQAISPKQNLTPITDQPYVGNLDADFRTAVSGDGQLYGVPFGGATGGGVLYNKKVFARAGVQVPKTWAEFMANNAKLKAAGIAPVIQTYGDTWTSQMFVLADFHNVAAADPTFAANYTANKAKFATTPAALASFQHLQEMHDAGYFNKNFASAKFDEGLTMVAKGTGAQYPMLSFAVGAMVANNPNAATDVGLYALPGTDAAKNGLTVWEPTGVFIPKSTTGAKLDAAKKFLAYIASPDGCVAQAKSSIPTGPYLVKGCTLPPTVPQVVKDIQAYLDKPGASSLALEFQSPVKGPALEQITVEVGSGIRKAASGAALYDEDVKKQAQQLGLAGW